MTRDVLIAERAQQEAQSNHDWWAEHRSAEQAARWYGEFMKAAASLSRNPERCCLAMEDDRFPYELRQLNFGIGRRATHRLVYTIRPQDVVILHVRHLAQEAIEPE
jgi:plasmid stabilization system protein ParE